MNEKKKIVKKSMSTLTLSQFLDVLWQKAEMTLPWFCHTQQMSKTIIM